MTNYASQYNFMDLLRDKDVVPLADVNSTPFVSIFKGLLEQLSAKIERSHEPHDFMDLMHDKGFTPAFCNDNYLTAEVV